jgi:hypothetical protein
MGIVFRAHIDDPKIKHLTFAPYGPALTAGPYLIDVVIAAYSSQFGQALPSFPFKTPT